MPYPPKDGGCQSMHYTASGLMKNGVDVSILAMNPSRNFINTTELPQDYVEQTKFRCQYVDTEIRSSKMLLNLLSNESYFTERFRSKQFETVLIELLKSNYYNIIQIEHLYMLVYLPIIRKVSKALVVFRPQNIEHLIWETYINNLNHPFKKALLKVATRRLKSFEIAQVQNVDGIMALTEQDAKVLKSFSDNVPIIDAPMGFDLDRIQDFDYYEQYYDFPKFYHLASMNWLPNRQAVNWFIEEVIPLIKAEIPNFQIHIAGRKMPDYLLKKKNENLIIQGEVKSSFDFQKNKAVMIVPLLSGSGIRAKIIEGLALGKTIISTSLGAQGIKYEQNKNILIADTPREFADQIIRCYRSKELCIKLGKNALDLSEKYYNINSVAKHMIKFYEMLCSKHSIQSRPA